MRAALLLPLLLHSARAQTTVSVTGTAGCTLNQKQAQCDGGLKLKVITPTTTTEISTTTSDITTLNYSTAVINPNSTSDPPSSTPTPPTTPPPSTTAENTTVQSTPPPSTTDPPTPSSSTTDPPTPSSSTSDPPTPPSSTTDPPSTTSDGKCNLAVGCSGWLTPIVDPSTTAPPEPPCPANTRQTQCLLKFIVNTTCVVCGTPVNLTTTIVTPKEACKSGVGDSFKTVYGQRCTKLSDGQTSSCMMGSEGYSWCSTEHLWWRDDHWFDWDLCGLCSTDVDPAQLTPHGFQCEGQCHNRHNNHESLAPRCTIKDPGQDKLGIGMDYCTDCSGGDCPDDISAPRDTRPGSQVGHIKWVVNKATEDTSGSGQRIDDYSYET